MNNDTVNCPYCGHLQESDNVHARVGFNDYCGEYGEVDIKCENCKKIFYIEFVWNLEIEKVKGSD